MKITRFVAAIVATQVSMLGVSAVYAAPPIPANTKFDPAKGTPMSASQMARAAKDTTFKRSWSPPASASKKVIPSVKVNKAANNKVAVPARVVKPFKPG